MTRKRARIIIALLFSMFTGIVLIFALRLPDVREGLVDPLREKISSLIEGESEDAGADDAAVVDAAVADAADLMAFDRPLRVVGLGWEPVAPGIVANGGSVPGPASMFGAAGLTVYLSGADSLGRLEAALAKGGASDGGADIAILPLPLFVSAYERIRALDPQVFYVVGWSRGREALLSTTDTLGPLEAGKDHPMIVDAQDLSRFLGLFAMEVAGADISHVRMLKVGSPSTETTQIAAIDRLYTAESVDAARRKILLTTVDAENLIPIVAIAQKSLIDHHAEVLSLWAHIWIDGQVMLKADVTSGAREVARSPGAIDEVNLLTRLGQIQSTTLSDNARMMGLAGRYPARLDMIFEQTWEIWRSSGVLATPVPPANPIDTRVVASLARQADPALRRPDARLDTEVRLAAQSGSQVAKPTSKPEDSVPLLVRQEPEGPEGREAFLRNIGTVAGIFQRSRIRVTAAKGETEEVIDAVVLRFGVSRARLVIGKAAVSKGLGVIEVLPTD